MGQIHPCQSNHFAQNRRAHRRGHNAHLWLPDMDTIARRWHNTALQFKPDKFLLRMGFAPLERCAADKFIRFTFQRHRKTNACLHWIGLIIKFGASKDQPSLNPHHIKRSKPKRRKPMRRTCGPNRVKNLFCVFRMAKHLIAQLSRISGPTEHHGGAMKAANPANRKAKPLQLFNSGLRGGRPNHIFQNFARQRPLHRHIAMMVRGRTYPCV